MGEGMEHSEEGYSHPRYPPRDYTGPADRGPRDYEGHNTERGRGRGFVSSSLSFFISSAVFVCFFSTEVLTSHLLAILCPNGTTVDYASLLCSFLLMLKEHNVDDDDNDDDTLSYIFHVLPDFY